MPVKAPRPVLWVLTLTALILLLALAVLLAVAAVPRGGVGVRRFV